MKCSRCSGMLILRNGRYGKFYGCSNYPACRYTQKTRRRGEERKEYVSSALEMKHASSSAVGKTIGCFFNNFDTEEEAKEFEKTVDKKVYNMRNLIINKPERDAEWWQVEGKIGRAHV